MNAVFSCGRTNDVHWISCTIGSCRSSFASFHNTYRHRIDQWILVVALIKEHFTTNYWNSKGITVITNSFYDTFEQPSCAVQFKITKTKRIQLCYWSGAHGENIAVNSTNTCGSTLIWLKCRRVIVRLDFKCTTQSIANVYKSGIFFTSLSQHASTIAR